MNQSIISNPDPINEFSARTLVVQSTGFVVSLLEVDQKPIFSSEFPGIDKNEGICGGDACIKGTRIPVWILVQFKKLGADEGQLLSMYPTINRLDLTCAFSYYELNQDEIDRQIYENEHA